MWGFGEKVLWWQLIFFHKICLNMCWNPKGKAWTDTITVHANWIWVKPKERSSVKKGCLCALFCLIPMLSSISVLMFSSCLLGCYDCLALFPLEGSSAELEKTIIIYILRKRQTEVRVICGAIQYTATGAWSWTISAVVFIYFVPFTGWYTKW